MPTWVKVVLILLLVLILGVATCTFVGYRWIKSHSGELLADAKKTKAEATEFGRGRDANACVDETFARLKQCGGIVCEVKGRVFLQDCLAVAERPADFCAAVPKRGEIMATAQWTLAECARRGRANDQQCTRVIIGIQDVCSR